jgi:dienelactone hydrolase
MYGSARQGENPDEAEKLAGPFYADTALVKSRLRAALEKAWSYDQADKNRVAMMGYCFGGYISLMAAKMNMPLRGAVSFHGNLAGTANNNVPILVLHGEADNFIPADQVAAWRKSMDSLGAQYTFKSYPGATHAFTNPNATEKGKKFNMPIEYNAAADSASWNEMKAFFEKIF